MQTITTYGLTGPALEHRKVQIEQAVKAGHIVRFHYGGLHFHKDVNSLAEGWEDDDLESFRRTGGRVPYVCWQSPELTIEILEPHEP